MDRDPREIHINMVILCSYLRETREKWLALGQPEYHPKFMELLGRGEKSIDPEVLAYMEQHNWSHGMEEVEFKLDDGGE